MEHLLRGAILAVTVTCLSGQVIPTGFDPYGEFGPAEDAGDSKPPADFPGVVPLKQPSPLPQQQPGLQVEPAALQSAFYIGIMHGWRLWHEAGTRDALTGPFLHDYFHSILETRGWDDGDTFYTSYVGHPMEGAVFGYIWQQNNPRYRTVEFGDGRAYWMSRLQAMEYSAILSTVWTLGPASEASMGNVQLHASPGVVDLVGTPILGIGWMVAEDWADRYVVSYVENRTANPWVLMVVRCFTNPTRSFAKLMALKQPWARDNRPSLFGESRILRQEAINSLSQHPGFGAPFVYRNDTTFTPAVYGEAEREPLPKESSIELQASAHYERFIHGGSCAGGGGTGSWRIAPEWMMVAEVTGCMVLGLPAPQSGDSLMYMVGNRWTPRPAGKWSPFAQLLIGGRRVTQEIPDPALQQQLLDEWTAGKLPHYPMRSEYQTQLQANGFSLAVGSGIDYVVKPAFAVHLANLQYTHSWLPRVGNFDASQGLRFEVGATLRVGTW